ncbi:hypothetical protein [Sphingomonas sp. NPDC079357]|jgi:hypothetical protein|uniref:hypothetical protein n=1 Tax=Sphingomonas sp. NPDC079357 TaxID=3364518 RepID=UPI00384CDBFD
MKRFQNDHDEIRAAMERFAALLTRGHDAIAAEMLRERVLFSQLLHRHRVDEDDQTSATLPGAPLAAALAADMQSLLAEYSAHVRAWPPARIPAEWDIYTKAVLKLQQRMRMRLAWEERELFPRLPAA